MKRLIHRAFWGIYSDEKNPLIQRRKKMDSDLEKLKTRGVEHEYVCYTYGTENHKYLLSKGVNSNLINPDPAPYDLKKEQYLHKIKAIQAAFEDGYDEVLVGAHRYTDDQSQEGAVFIFYGSSAGLNSTAGDDMTGNKAETWFGYAAGTAGDVNQDGFADVIVGAPEYKIETDRRGRVFAYLGSGSSGSNEGQFQVYLPLILQN